MAFASNNALPPGSLIQTSFPWHLDYTYSDSVLTTYFFFASASNSSFSSAQSYSVGTLSGDLTASSRLLVGLKSLSFTGPYFSVFSSGTTSFTSTRRYAYIDIPLTLQSPSSYWLLSGNLDFAVTYSFYLTNELLPYMTQTVTSSTLTLRNSSLQSLASASSTTGRYSFRCMDKNSVKPSFLSIRFDPPVFTSPTNRTGDRISMTIYCLSSNLQFVSMPSLPSWFVSNYNINTSGSTYVPGNNETIAGNPYPPDSGGSTQPDYTNRFDSLDQAIKNTQQSVKDGANQVEDAINNSTNQIMGDDSDPENPTGIKGILHWLKNLPANILKAIAEFFIPTSEAIEDFINNLRNALENDNPVFTLANFALDIIDSVVDALDGEVHSHAIDFPGIVLNMNGKTYTLVTAQQVDLDDNPLVVQLRPVLSTIGIIIATLALINTVVHLAEALFVSRLLSYYTSVNSNTSLAVKGDD